MKIVKFRAWYKEKKKMIYEIGILSKSILINNWHWDWSNFEVMQFIGEKDKKHKDIYEKDIIRRRDRIWTVSDDVKYSDLDINKRPKGEALAVVEFGNASFWARRIKGKEWSFYCPDGSTFNWNEIEVIGNIYENSELLKGTEYNEK